jgi:hypothetical protein
VKFKTKSLHYQLIIGYEEKFIKEITNTKFTEEFIITFIGKVIDQMTSKLSDACYAVWIMFMISYIDTPWMIYFASTHSVIKYEIIFWGKFF